MAMLSAWSVRCVSGLAITRCEARPAAQVTGDSQMQKARGGDGELSHTLGLCREWNFNKSSRLNCLERLFDDREHADENGHLIAGQNQNGQPSA